MGAKKVAISGVVLALSFGLVVTLDPFGWRDGEPSSEGKLATGSPSAPESERRVPAAQIEEAILPKAGAEHPVQVEKISAPLFGIVLLSDGDPAPGTEISAYLLDVGTVWKKRPGVKPTATAADDQGRFRFEVLDAARWCIVARSRDGPYAVIPEVKVPRSVSLRIMLKNGFSLEGLVTDEEEVPVAGATAKVLNMRPLSEPWYPVSHLDVSTDNDGRFRLTGVPEGSCQLVFGAPGYWDGSETVDIPRQEPVVIRLKRGTYVAGRVYLRDRLHPLPNAEVGLYESSPFGWGGHRFKTGREGEFVSEALKSGEHILTFTYEQFQPVTIRPSLTEDSPETDLEIIFLEGITVQGVVRNSEGMPIFHAPVRWGRIGSRSSVPQECFTDGQGCFEMKGVEAGRYRVEVDGLVIENGHISYWRPIEEVTVDEEGPQWVEVTVDIPQPILLRLEDSEDAPVQGVCVTCEYGSGRGRARWISKPTDNDGFTSVRRTPAEGELQLQAGNREMGMVIARIDPACLSEPVVLRLEPWGVLTGRVADTEGEPVPDAEVVAAKPYLVGGRTSTDMRGEFELPLPAGEWTVGVTAGSFGKKELEGLRVSPNAANDLATIVVGEVENVIRGRVRDAEGRPLEGIEVDIRCPAHRDFEHMASARTDAKGWFAALVKPGEYTIGASRRGFYQVEPIGEVRPGDPPVEIRLRKAPERTVAGQVFYEGQPLEGARVTWCSMPVRGIHSHSWTAALATDRNGAFELSEIGPGVESVVIVAQSRHFAFARSEEVVLPPEGRVDGVRVTPVPGVDFEARIVDSSGKAVVSARVSLYGEADRLVGASGLTDSDGIWRLKQLPSGEYRLWVDCLARHSRAEKTFSWGDEAGPVTVTVQPIGGNSE